MNNPNPFNEILLFSTKLNVLSTEFENFIMMFSWQNKGINHEINDIITSPFILCYYILTQIQLKSKSYTYRS